MREGAEEHVPNDEQGWSAIQLTVYEHAFLPEANTNIVMAAVEGLDVYRGRGIDG